MVLIFAAFGTLQKFLSDMLEIFLHRIENALYILRNEVNSPLLFVGSCRNVAMKQDLGWALWVAKTAQRPCISINFYDNFSRLLR